jgi:uncharacterized coiled-coil protein SlyX
MGDNVKIEKMESGELEMRQAFEEVTTRNVRGAVEFTNETRKIVRGLEKKVVLLEEKSLQQDKTIDELRKQIVNIQMKMYQLGGN